MSSRACAPTLPTSTLENNAEVMMHSRIGVSSVSEDQVLGFQVYGTRAPPA